MGTIESADEFYRLRTSSNPAEYNRAAHDTASDDVWREIIAHFPDMRQRVAHNKTVPVSMLEILATDADWRVRHMVALKRKLPEQLQLQLARDKNKGVRRTIACNAKATPRALKMLIDDPVADIREHARSRLQRKE